MDVVLITLGVLGIGAIIVSTYVFMVAARNYVSDQPNPQSGSALYPLVERSSSDRRTGQVINFPVMVNGILIEKDRRILPDRRRALAA
jgi:hypothetical protein